MDHTNGALPLAAIDIGANAVRLKIVRALSDGSLETLHEERDPIRPGSKVFTRGKLTTKTEARLGATLGHFLVTTARYGAEVRAVATSSFRDAQNGEEVADRIHRALGVRIRVLSGQEEARLIALGVLRDLPPQEPSLALDLGGGSTEIILGVGNRAETLFSLPLGAVRLTDRFELHGTVERARLEALRELVFEQLSTLPPLITPPVALGTSGMMRALIGFACGGDGEQATAEQLRHAVVALVQMSPRDRRRWFDAQRARTVVAGSVILEGLLDHFQLERLRAVRGGLSDGVLVELALARLSSGPEGPRQEGG